MFVHLWGAWDAWNAWVLPNVSGLPLVWWYTHASPPFRSCTYHSVQSKHAGSTLASHSTHGFCISRSEWQCIHSMWSCHYWSSHTSCMVPLDTLHALVSGLAFVFLRNYNGRILRAKYVATTVGCLQLDVVSRCSIIDSATLCECCFMCFLWFFRVVRSLSVLFFLCCFFLCCLLWMLCYVFGFVWFILLCCFVFCYLPSIEKIVSFFFSFLFFFFDCFHWRSLIFMNVLCFTHVSAWMCTLVIVFVRSRSLSIYLSCYILDDRLLLVASTYASTHTLDLISIYILCIFSLKHRITTRRTSTHIRH